MSLSDSTIVTTVGGASSNSYVSLSDFNTYRDLYRVSADGFDRAEPDAKIRALLVATRRLERENWRGNRASSTQNLAWPRYGVPKRDGALVGGADPIPGAGALLGYRTGYGIYSGGYYGELWESTAIPQPVKDAQCELALAYLDGYEADTSGGIDSFQADGISVKMAGGGPQGGLPSAVAQLISGMTQGPRLVRS